ncbi:MAG: sulfurtransferase TusA family protein [Pseudomonadales bacterium]
MNRAGGDDLPKADQQLDASGLTCPMPLLKAKQALNRLAAGAVLEVQATDPGSERDFAVFARQSGHELLLSQRQGEQFVYLLRKAH